MSTDVKKEACALTTFLVLRKYSQPGSVEVPWRSSKAVAANYNTVLL